MSRFRYHSILGSLAAAVIATGCASWPARNEPALAADPVENIIAKNAADATNALRELSENTGATRMAGAGQKNRPQNTAGQNSAGASIAGKMGSIPVEPGQSSRVPINDESKASTSALPAAMAVPAGLEKLLTIKWTGDLESLLFIIGKETGWKVNEPTGLRISPVIIALNAVNRPAYEVLRDIGAIAGSGADVVISVPNRTLAVAYPSR